jgi:hypothetical protein
MLLAYLIIQRSLRVKRRHFKVAQYSSGSNRRTYALYN